MTAAVVDDSVDEVAALSYNDLLTNDAEILRNVDKTLELAFGSAKSLGVLLIRGIPGFEDAKKNFLPMGHALKSLPQSYLENNLRDITSLYNAGWSHGKEKLGDKPDTAKGSFYFNPIKDVPGTEEERQMYPASYPSNKWPDDDLIPGFEHAAKRLGQLMKEVVVQLSKRIDAYAYINCREGSYPANFLYETMRDTEKVKGRLLYYYPLTQEQTLSTDKEGEDSWIGWHNDSGFITALAGDIYIDDKSGQIVQCPDPAAGLYVERKNGKSVHINIPPDCMAVQLGECLQILTGGSLVGTPHCVRGIDPAVSTNIARISFPCFVDSVPTFPLKMPSGMERENILKSGSKTDKVPPLGERWTHDGMTFGAFLQRSIEVYYSWTQK